MLCCMHACMRVCVHACMRVCVYACMRVCVHAWCMLSYMMYAVLYDVCCAVWCMLCYMMHAVLYDACCAIGCMLCYLSLSRSLALLAVRSLFSRVLQLAAVVMLRATLSRTRTFPFPVESPSNSRFYFRSISSSSG